MSTDHQHPAWCSQGRHCDPPRVCVDGTREWVHSTYSAIVPIRDGVVDIFTVRIDSVAPDGEHHVCTSIVLTGSGSLTAEQAATLGRGLLAAAEQLAAGLPDAPGDHTDTEQGDGTHG